MLKLKIETESRVSAWRKNMITLVFILIGPLTASAGNTELDEFRAQIRIKYDMKEAAFAANDPEPILTGFYHPEVVSTGPDGVTYLGRDGLRPVYNEIIGSDVRIESYRTFVAGNAGWDWVNFHVTPPVEAHEEPFTFKLLFLWARENGEWWSHGEMYVIGKFDTVGAENK